MADEIELKVTPELDGARVDKALATLLTISRADSRALVDEGVFVDGARVRPSDRVRAGATVRSPAPTASIPLRPEPVPFVVLYEDGSLLVIDKPAGAVVHPGSGRTRGTIAAGLLHRYPDLEGVGQENRWGLVHRLDKDTSGAMIVARTSESYQALSEMIRRREITRVYTALVDGLFNAPTGTIDAPIGRDPLRATRRAAVHDGKPARTHYEVTRAIPEHECSLLTVRLDTGRTHQIRVHMASIGHPVIGDHTYGGGVSGTRSPRMFLHASRVGFRHPDTGLALEIEAPLPEDLAGVLAAMGVTPSEYDPPSDTV